MFFFAVTIARSSGYTIGDKATDFKLKNVDQKYVSLSNYPDAKGFVVIFTCNGCPYAQAYQDRIIEIDKKYKPLGYPVIAINPN
ncbi:MAG TPA: thioredoxin family protein, partial [Prolixibacteraceae bacterium]|nr:thioredoxin family protein [Prolixibacteraceae bacterium]